jgi:hypothetical protein
MPSVSFAQAPVKREVLEMTELSERRIRQSIQDYLGPDTRAVVSVYYKEKGLSAPSPVPTTTTEQVIDNSNWMISGPYAPENPEQASTTNGTSIEMESVEVSIQVEKIVDAKSRAEIEKLAKESLRGLPVKVSVQSSLSPPVAQVVKDRKEAEDAARKPASVSDVVDGALEKFTKRYGPFAPLAASLLLFLGVLIVAMMLRSSAKEIAEGLKSMRPAVSNSGSQTISLNSPVSGSPQIENKGSTGALPGGDTRRPALPAATSMGGEVRKNLQFIESYLMETPLLFVRSVTDDPSDLMGLKFLVSKFSPEARTKLKELIGVERLLKASSYQAGEEVVGFNAGGWLQQLIEKIELKKLAGGTVIEEALSNDESLLLSNAAKDKLLEAALKVNTPAAWRVVTDFVSSDFLKARGREFDRQMWSNVIKGSLVADSKEVHEAARQIIDIVRFSVSENTVLFKAQRERDEHFTKQLLPSLIDSILMQELGEDDEFIGFIVQETPEFAKTIRTTVWTPSRLKDISDESLKSIFMGLDTEKKSYLLFAFPPEHAKRFEGYLPEGNGKKIVMDAVGRLKATADQPLKDRSRALAREFLDYLRVEVLRGKIQLKEGALEGIQSIGGGGRASPTEAEVIEVDTEESQRKAS